MRTSLCLMTRNELDGCRATVPSIPEGFCEVFAVDGGSDDGTVEYLQLMGVGVVAQQESGYNGAYRTALDRFSGDAIVFFHPKGTIDPGTLSSMRQLLEQGADLVIANRNMRGARNEEDEGLLRPRKWFVLVLSAVAAIRWRTDRSATRTTDVLHGYRGLSRDFVSGLRLESGPAVTADLEIVRHAYLTSARLVEFPVIESARSHGATHFPAWATGRRLLRYLVAHGRSTTANSRR